MSEPGVDPLTGLRVLVAAAGAGRRAGLPYPKTLHPVEGRPILVRILELVRELDPEPTVVVSPDGEAPIAACLAQHGLKAHLVVQPTPRGMGDAVLQFERSPAANGAEQVLLIWGDLPFVRAETVAAVSRAHRAHDATLTFPTRAVKSAYTLVTRDGAGRVRSLVETRELGEASPGPGERDIGVFLFKPGPVLALLREDLPGRRGPRTGEHGFLYLVEHLVERGHRVEALPIATAQELVSLNALADLGPGGSGA